MSVVDISDILENQMTGTKKNDVAFLWTKLYKSISSFEFIIQKVNTKFGYESNHTSGS